MQFEQDENVMLPASVINQSIMKTCFVVGPLARVASEQRQYSKYFGGFANYMYCSGGQQNAKTNVATTHCIS